MGCGAGHSSISVAEAFPLVTVHAVDCDKTSMDKAAVNISTAVEEKRIRPGQVVTHCCMAHEASVTPGSVDMVLTWIALHDMHNPSHVLSTVKPMLAPGGCMLVLEFSNPDNYTDIADLSQDDTTNLRGQAKFCLSVSVLHCLPVSKTVDPSQVLH